MRLVGNLESLIAGQDAAGGPTTRYELFAENIRFGMSDWRVSEANAAQQIVSQILTYIVMRWRPGIVPTMRLVHPSDRLAVPPVIDYYDIQGAIRHPSTRWALQLVCVKKDATNYRTGTVP